MDDNEISNVVTNMNRPYVENVEDLEGPDSRFGGGLPEIGLGQIERNIDESNIWSYHAMTDEDLFNSCVAHHGVDPNDDHRVYEDPPPHEISSSLAYEPPFEI